MSNLGDVLRFLLDKVTTQSATEKAVVSDLIDNAEKDLGLKSPDPVATETPAATETPTETPTETSTDTAPETPVEDAASDTTQSGA